MRNEVVRLSVHKNNSAQRKNKIRRKEMINSARELSQGSCIQGYCFVSFGDDGYEARYHDPDGIVRTSDLPTYLKNVMRREIGLIDGGEDDS